MNRKQLAPVPGELLSTRLTWQDLSLPDSIREQLQAGSAGLAAQDHKKTALLYGPNPWKGSQFLFYGPAHGAKVLAAQLMGGDLGVATWVIPSATLLGRYIGETEKNLNRIFDRARQTGWILFFDEADALFGKRTSVQSDNDRYANIEIAYLLQCAEAYRGPVILCTSESPSLGGRVRRRFEALLEFPGPDQR